jgi:hypothetical protein
VKILNLIVLVPKLGIKCKSLLHLNSQQKKRTFFQDFSSCFSLPRGSSNALVQKSLDLFKSWLNTAFYNFSSLASTRSIASRVFSMLLLKANFASGSSLCTALTMRSKNGTTASVFRMPTTTVNINQSVLGYLFPGSQRKHLLPTITTSHFFSRSLVVQRSNDMSGVRYSISQS